MQHYWPSSCTYLKLLFCFDCEGYKSAINLQLKFIQKKKLTTKVFIYYLKNLQKKKKLRNIFVIYNNNNNK